jgi:hypothetical protein
MTGRKLQIGKLSIWTEDGNPRLSGLPLDEALIQVREWIEYAESWQQAVDDERKKELTPA